MNMEFDREWLLAFWQRHNGKIICCTIGLFFGVLVLALGFFRTLFLFLCIGIGFFVGKRLDNKEDLLELLDRILPPGYRR
ncbi:MULTISPECIES: DUF2273 domain-containing protein [Sporomusaceae]|uniref:DUF2273 domain-containing protein n=1 Tax=Sporomusaceae TaxID=1843490 RepID=UPI00037A6B43|nr:MULTISPECIES: DUF2273 domain-containing protein [Sporomusaceae]